ncbi:hypothetical protein GQX74_007756 [Glossina fuscipes]|nr:hypothetical protein GQX74_007756 [Glossina fuscipes]
MFKPNFKTNNRPCSLIIIVAVAVAVAIALAIAITIATATVTATIATIARRVFLFYQLIRNETKGSLAKQSFTSKSYSIVCQYQYQFQSSRPRVEGAQNSSKKFFIVGCVTPLVDFGNA